MNDAIDDLPAFEGPMNKIFNRTDMPMVKIITDATEIDRAAAATRRGRRFKTSKRN